MRKIKTSFKILALTAAAMALSACETNPTVPEPKIEYRTRNLLAVMPDHLLPNCLQPVPPDRVAYPNLSNEDKERVLTDYIQGLHATVSTCNTTIDSARKWNAKQKEIFLKRPQDGLANVQ